MAKLRGKARKRSTTVKGKFPITDKAHARNALARLNQAKGLSAADKRKVVKRAYAKLGTPKSKRKVSISKAGRVKRK